MQLLELVHRPLEPAHEEHPQREAVGDEDQVHVGVAARLLLEAPDVNVRPQRLSETWKKGCETNLKQT